MTGPYDSDGDGYHDVAGNGPTEIQNQSNSPGIICMPSSPVHVMVSTTSVIWAPNASIGSSSVRNVVAISQPGLVCTDT